MNGTPAPALIGVSPAEERHRRPRLFGALESAYPVRFEGRAEDDWDGLDGLLAVGPGAPAAVAAARPALPTLTATGEERPPAEVRSLTLADHLELARPLRGARLSEGSVGGSPPLAGPARAEVLARLSDGPAWTAWQEGGQRAQAVAALPAELAGGEALRERLMPGRCLALLALAQFVQGCLAGRSWATPPLQAAFLFDDPNLHWPSYGHVRYPELASHAAEHGYHVAVAMVPLDGWLVHPRVARLFRACPDRLSVCIHGNHHSGPELGRPRSQREGRVPATEALRRVASFERRSGVPVSRVMVPPHERLSEAAGRALLESGYEAVCVTRPYSWIEPSSEDDWLARPPAAGPLTGWGSAEVVAGGLPLLLRSAFELSREDLVLRAFLGQPLILYGHHQHIQDGLGVLADAAAEVARLGDVRWCSLEAIARGRVETRREGSALAVRPHARRVRVPIPEGVNRLEVDLSRISGDGPSTVELAETAPAEHELTLAPATPAPPSAGPRLRPPPLWPLARRVAAESRDRLAAL